MGCCGRGQRRQVKALPHIEGIAGETIGTDYRFHAHVEPPGQGEQGISRLNHIYLPSGGRCAGRGCRWRWQRGQRRHVNPLTRREVYGSQAIGVYESFNSGVVPPGQVVQGIARAHHVHAPSRRSWAERRGRGLDDGVWRRGGHRRPHRHSGGCWQGRGCGRWSRRGRRWNRRGGSCPWGGSGCHQGNPAQGGVLVAHQQGSQHGEQQNGHQSSADEGLSGPEGTGGANLHPLPPIVFFSRSWSGGWGGGRRRWCLGPSGFQPRCVPRGAPPES